MLGLTQVTRDRLGAENVGELESLAERSVEQAHKGCGIVLQQTALNLLERFAAVARPLVQASVFMDHVGGLVLEWQDANRGTVELVCGPVGYEICLGSAIVMQSESACKIANYFTWHELWPVEG